MEDSTLLRKTSCPDCGSSDANAVYDDGHEFCFSCNTHRQGDKPMQSQVTLTSGGELDRLVAKWSASKAQSIPERSLTSASVGKYGVVVDGDWHYYPYFAEGQTEPVAFKVRGPNKAFRVVGDLKDAGLFGQQKFGNYDRKRVIVTEGELDALAVQQMMNNSDAVVSLRGGAAGAGRDFKSAYQFLDGFQEILVCFDADQAGQDAIAKAADVFAGKLRIIKLDPSVGSDPCDYLKSGNTKAFTDAYWSASQYVPKGVLSYEDICALTDGEEPDAMGQYPWEALNKLTYGFRGGELITLCAGSGMGKSAVLRELVYHVKQTTPHRIGTLFLEESTKRTIDGFIGIDLSVPVHLPTSPISRKDEEYKQARERCFKDGQLLVVDGAFDTEVTVEQIVSKVRFMVKALDCRVIILDHISILVSAGQHGDERKALDSIMTKLRTMVHDTGITLFAVSHLKRPEGKSHEDGAVTSVGQLRGSASIAQLSDFVIGLERNGQADDPIERNTTHMRVLKNRFSGITGPAGHLLYNNDTGRLHEHEPEDTEDVL